MNFAAPFWLYAGTALCGLLAWSWHLYDKRQRAALASFASHHLHAQLTASLSVTRRRWKRGLYLAGVALLFLALARSQAGFRWEETKRSGIEILFAVDTSKSMLTPDIKPNRLTRAKMAVDDFVGHLDGDGVGLIAFAGNAFLQCPVTLDYDAFNESLAALDTRTIPRGGTDLSSAIREATVALQNRTGSDKILILLTDGEDLEGNAIDAAKAAAQAGLKIYTVGVGTSNGDLIPLPAESGGGFVKDTSGQYVKSRLDEKTLQAIAAATGGMYAPLGDRGQGLETIYQTALAPLAKHTLASRQQRVYIERYQWFLLPSLLLLIASLLIGTRRQIKQPARREETALAGALAMVMLLGLLSQARASVSDADAAYQKGDFVTAQREFDAAAATHAQNNILQFDAGTAAYKAGQYPIATEDFQKSLGGKQSADPKQLAIQEDAYYNLGNTLYRAGQKTERSQPQQTIQSWEEAIKSYDAALQIHPTDADAKFNRDFVQKKLDALKKNQPPPPQNNPKQNQQNPEKSAGPSQPKNGGQQQGQQTNNQSQNNPASPENSANSSSLTQKGSQSNESNTAPEERTPGQMSKEEARQLLDSLKGEQRQMPGAPVNRTGTDHSSDQPVKDW